MKLKEQFTDDYLPTIELKNNNLMIDGKNLFDQQIRNHFITYHHTRKISTGQEDDCSTVCLLDYDYFQKDYKMMVTDLSKQQALDSDPKATQ